MRWSWKIATFSGIGVYIHATFLLLVGYFLLVPLFRGDGVLAALASTAFILLLFLCVVLHEFGHALTAQRYGIQTRDITLYPIGGVARLERIPRNPRQELLIALAGPAVNVVIAAVLFLGLLAAGARWPQNLLELTGGNLVWRLLVVNVILVLFNMLPAFPMDGGRVLRALLAERMEYGKATQTAATVGQAMAFAFGLLGLLGGNPILVFVAFFVYIGAAQEAAAVQTELAFQGVPVRDAMMVRFRGIAPDETLGRAAEHLLAGSQQDFPVMTDGMVTGILTRKRLIDALSRQGPAAQVSEVMEPAPPPVSPADSLETTFQHMRELDVQAVPVMVGDRIVGLVTLENIGEFLMIKTALQAPAPDGAASHAAPNQAEAEEQERSRAMSWARRARG